MRRLTAAAAAGLVSGRIRRQRWRGPSARAWRRGLAVVAAAAVVAGGWSLTAAHGGAEGAWRVLTTRAGLAVEEVLVTGRHNAEVPALLGAVGVSRGDSLLAIDPAAVRDRVEALAWVRTARVARRLPDTLVLHVEERRPMALWQHEQRLVLIDAEGVVLAADGLERFAHLPHVVGADADVEAQAFLALLTVTPAVAGRVAAAVRVGERRWDLRLDNGVTVRLPAVGAADALVRLAALQRREDVFDRDVVAIDLRLPDRLYIEMTPAGAERRRLPEEST